MPLETPIEMTTPEDTAGAFVNAIFKQKPLEGKIFNLGGGENCRISYKKFLSVLFNIFGLGKISFPEYAFATRNFHSDHYSDGNILENILHFRKDNKNSYVDKVKFYVKPFTRFFTFLVSPIIKSILL